MVVLPAPSRPRINIRTSLSPQSLLKRLLKSAPIKLIVIILLYAKYPSLPIIVYKKEKRKNNFFGPVHITCEELQYHLFISVWTAIEEEGDVLYLYNLL